MRFDGTLFQTGTNTGIEVPPDVLDALGGGRRPAVTVIVNGFAFTSTVGAMGGRALIPFSADKRAATGLAGGDAIEVDVELDAAPREVTVPTDLAGALEEAGATAAFDSLAPSARRAQIASIEGAKTPETRARRIASLLAKLAD